MRNLLLLLSALILLHVNSYAQKIDFMDSSNKWREMYYSPPAKPNPGYIGYRHYKYLDTTVNVSGKSYKYIIENQGDTLYVRKDSTGRIWGIFHGWPYMMNSTLYEEQLMYDFNLNKGNSYTNYYHYLDQGNYKLLNSFCCIL